MNKNLLFSKTITQFPENIKFKYNWRKYQKRFLDNFQSYLEDNHIHVIAPPGSGKTVLGLEVMLRLNQPTLIIAPTIAIKNQWINRFTELFLQTHETPTWISGDLSNMSFVTVTTYQGIHSAMTGVIKDEESQEKKSSKTLSKTFIKDLKHQYFKTLILDEAHHLKNAWWRSLTELKNILEPTIVALTATPPFDVSPSEWKNYSELNGLVDIEISVPELMQENNLCPHQDLVHFSLPTKIEQEKIEKIHQKAQHFFDEICQDELVLNIIKNHPIYLNPKSHFEFIYENISSYTSGLVYMNYRGLKIDDVHFKIIGDKSKFIPEFDFFWLEELLDFYLFTTDSHFKIYEEERLELENQLRRNGFIENKWVNFFNIKSLTKILNSSIGKLEAIKNITISEYNELKSDLRLVILTDFIRKEFLSTEKENNLELNKIGAISAFEKLRREQLNNHHLAVLTGSIVILPKHILKSHSSKISVPLSYQELSFDETFVQISINDQTRNIMVEWITQLFEDGEIQILIGTKSLLGEGWDAPKINTLILASYVSTFVLTNQMRGRAIRTDKYNPNKTSNIWHLVTYDEHDTFGGHDYQKLQKRFKTFVGISNTKPTSIENNFQRLGIPNISSADDIKNINYNMFELAKARDLITEKWDDALENGSVLIEEIQIPFDETQDYETAKYESLSKSIKNFSGLIISSILMFWTDFLSIVLKFFKSTSSPQMASIIIMTFGFAGFITYGGLFYRSLMQYLRYKNISKRIDKIAKIILMSLKKEGIIKSPLSKLKISVSHDEHGNSICHLEGGSNYEKSRFILTLKELLSPVDNPRYLLATKGFLFSKSAMEYYPIPEIFGKNKKSASYFSEVWTKELEASEIVFTRTIEGRNLLLKLRFQTIMKKNKHIEHIQKWVR